jgi:hypothetical protein
MDSRLIIPKTCPLYFGAFQLTTEKTMYPNKFRYIQKFDTNDTIHVQIRFTSDQPENEGLHIKAYGLNDVFIDDYSFTWTTLGTYKYGDAYIPCTSFSGYTYFQIHDSSTTFLTPLAESWPVEVGTWPDSVAIIYFNTENDFETFFGTFSATSVFMIRVEGGFPPDGFTPKWDFENFTDQLSQDTLSYSLPYGVHTLYLGDSNGLSWFIIDKLNYIFSLDTIYLNGTQWVRNSEITIENAVAKIDMKQKNNNMLQSSGGLVGIMDEEGQLITNQWGGILLA